MRKRLFEKIRNGGTTRVVINTLSETITVKQFDHNDGTFVNDIYLPKTDALQIAVVILTYFNRDADQIIIQTTKENKL